MNIPSVPQDLSAYLDTHFTCSCGREHYAPLKRVSIGKDALYDLPRFAKELGFHSLYLICDPITYDIAGRRCMEILAQANVPSTIRILDHTGFDEATVGELVFYMPKECDLMVAVGTGSINDMTRFLSCRMGRPFFTVATAAPMDGFASALAVLNINHFKTSVNAQTPTAIIGDTEILKIAPYRMIAAGLGDLLGKSTCLCDWKLSRIINQEHYCENIVALVENCVQQVLSQVDRVKERDPEVLGKIMEGLVLTGVAMSLYGNSRPASGCEHHISHYWEMIFEQAGMRPAPHGIQVGVGTVLILRLVEALKTIQVDFEAARTAARAYRPEVWEKEIRDAYGTAAQGIIELEHDAHKNSTQGRLQRIDAIQLHWNEILQLLDSLPRSEDLVAILKSLASPCTPAEIGVDTDLLRKTLLYCKEVRPRYTILQMLWDLDVLKPLVESIL